MTAGRCSESSRPDASTHVLTPLLQNICSTRPKGTDQRLEVEQLRCSIALLAPGAPDAVGREQALLLLTELHDVQGRLDAPKRGLRELAEQGSDGARPITRRGDPQTDQNRLQRDRPTGCPAPNGSRWARTGPGRVAVLVPPRDPRR